MQTSLGAPGSVTGFFTLFRPVSFNSDKRPCRARRVFAAAIGALVLGLGASEASAQSVEVTASPVSFSSAGQTVTLSYLFKSGVFVIDSFSVTSNLPGVAVSCPVSSLPISSQTTCTATYTVTSGNISAGSFTEQAAYVAVSDNGTDLSGASLPLTVLYDFATATRLTTSGSPSIFGQSVDFTATVRSNNGGTPTGNVVFSDTNGMLDTIALDFAGKAVFTTSTLPVGSHDITAAYQGDGTYQASVSAPRRQVVNKANAAAGLNFPVSIVVGTPVDLQAILSGNNGTPTGQVTFKDDGSVLATKTLDSSGRATLTVSDFTVGDHTISFDYSGDSTYKARSFTGSPKLTVEKADPSVRIRSSLNPSMLGEEVTFKALVGGASGGAPTGTVDFSNGTDPLGTVPVRVLGAPATMTTGGSHTCALTSVGGVECWGLNNFGQVGDGTKQNRLAPQEIAGLSSGVVSIVGGGNHTCALTSAGGVQCWGANASGQLGDGTFVDRTTPTDVVGLSSGVKALFGGVVHTCALMAAGGAKCWGANLDGQLGDGTKTTSPIPVDVVGLAAKTKTLVAGLAHSCALSTGGGVQCWGSNVYGQIGDGTNTQRSTPTDVVGLISGVSALYSASSHTCALMTGGGAKCWGKNTWGNLGDGTQVDRSTPVDVVGPPDLAAIFTGHEHSCALTASGGAKCWGFNNYGQVGDDTVMFRTTPVDVSGLASGVVTIEGGIHHTCAVTGMGAVQCWGRNAYGALGDGTDTNRRTPGEVEGFGPYQALVYGTAEFSTADLSVGTHPVKAAYSGSGNHHAATSDALSQQVDKAQTATAVASSDTTTVFGEEVTFTATLTSGGGTPQGDVTFLDGTTPLGTVPLANGTADLTTGALSRATHQMTAVYSGNENFLASTSDPLKQVVERGDTSTALASTGNTVTGQQVTFTATVSVDSPAAGTPTGTVSFYADGAKLGTTGVSASGSASLAVSDLPVGGHTVTAEYDGDGNFNTSRSADLAHVVDPGKTRTVLSSGGNTVFGEQATFKIKLAAMSPAVGTPTGRVVLFAGTIKLGSARLDAGKATFRSAKLATGKYRIVAEYRGDDGFAASTSGSRPHTVRKGKTAVKLKSSAPAAPDGPSDTHPGALPGEDIVFSVKVKPRSPAAGTPDGVVELRHGGAVVETAELDGGVAAFTRAFETGDHMIAIAYGGSASWKSASSDDLMLTIDPRAREFQVNTTVKQAQQGAAVAGLDDGTFVAVWSSSGQDGSGRSLHMQRFKKTASGKVKKSGKEAQVNSHTPGDQRDGVVVGVKKASWFAAWESVDQDAASLGEDQSTGIYMQRYRANGKPNGGEMRVNVETMLDQTDVALAGLGGKAMAAAWVSQDQDGDGTGIYARLFKADGTPKTGDIQVNDDVSGDQADPAIAGLSGGGVAVAFRTPDADGTGIAMRLFDKSGKAKGKMKRVNTETAEDQTEPAIASLKNGDFIVSWSSHAQDGSQTGIFAQRFNAKGKARGGEIQVNTTTEMAQAQSHITALADGGFLVAWHSQDQDGSGFGIYAQRFTAKGKAKGVEFRVNQTVKHDQAEPALTTLPDGSVIAAWTSDKQDGAKDGIFGIKLDFADAVGDAVAGRAQ